MPALRAVRSIANRPVFTAARRHHPEADPEAGMTTAEYAVGTVAACGFAALLYEVVTSGTVRTLMTQLIERALHAVT